MSNTARLSCVPQLRARMVEGVSVPYRAVIQRRMGNRVGGFQEGPRRAHAERRRGKAHSGRWPGRSTRRYAESGGTAHLAVRVGGDWTNARVRWHLLSPALIP